MPSSKCTHLIAVLNLSESGYAPQRSPMNALDGAFTPKDPCQSDAWKNLENGSSECALKELANTAISFDGMDARVPLHENVNWKGTYRVHEMQHLWR